jgi:drug/metabolite transporter (DMT)-like permease
MNRSRAQAGEKVPSVKGRPDAARKQDAQETIDPVGLISLLTVYLAYGSTYLAIRVAVRPGGGFSPFTLGFMRLILAGIILLAWGVIRRKRMLPERDEWLILIGSGILFWTIANGLVGWAEMRADSGLAALIVAFTPIWVAFIESLIDRHAPSLLLLFSLLLGFGGIVLLSVPSLQSGVQADLYSLIALLAASCSWGLGSVLQSRRKVRLSPEVSSGYQQLIGGFGFIISILLVGDTLPTPTDEAWLAWGYLVLVGSVLGFTAFTQALKLLPSSVAMTYAYVNPVIAVILGAIILGEEITLWTFAGASLVLLGVAGVFRERYGGSS